MNYLYSLKDLERAICTSARTWIARMSAFDHITQGSLWKSWDLSMSHTVRYGTTTLQVKVIGANRHWKCLLCRFEQKNERTIERERAQPVCIRGRQRIAKILRTYVRTYVLRRACVLSCTGKAVCRLGDRAVREKCENGSSNSPCLVQWFLRLRCCCYPASELPFGIKARKQNMTCRYKTRSKSPTSIPEVAQVGKKRRHFSAIHSIKYAYYIADQRKESKLCIVSSVLRRF